MFFFLPVNLTEAAWAKSLSAVVMDGSLLMISVVTTFNSCPLAVDKNKTKVGSRRPQPQPSPPNARTGPQNVPQAGVRQSKQNNESIRPPKQLLTASNQRFQALVVVLQKTLAEVRKVSFLEIP